MEERLYRFRPDQKWFDSAKENWNTFVRVTKRVGSLAKTIGKASGVAWPIVETGNMVLEKLPEATRAASSKFAEMLGEKERPEFIDLETRHLLQPGSPAPGIISNPAHSGLLPAGARRAGPSHAAPRRLLRLRSVAMGSESGMGW